MKKLVLLFAIFLCSALAVIAQQTKKPYYNPDWSKPYPAFKIAGNLYYVGTYDLASYLLVTPKGNILINTGLDDSYPLIKNSIESLGFSLKDTKILLITQAHHDHTGALAQIKKETGAKLLVNKPDADALKTGGKSDYEMGKYGELFEPVVPDKLLKDKSTIKLGGTKLTLLSHPGHTQGSCSYLVNVKDGDKTYKVLIANLPSIVIDGKFSEVKTYPNIQKDYAYTLNAMKNSDFDLWVASHASQFDLHELRQPNDSYNPTIFGNKKLYFEYLSDLEKNYLEKLKEDDKK
jgi:glyoxylase-like metal-dependent hydrolase (beta-lactamase superfamily II)